MGTLKSPRGQVGRMRASVYQCHVFAKPFQSFADRRLTRSGNLVQHKRGWSGQNCPGGAANRDALAGVHPAGYDFMITFIAGIPCMRHVIAAVVQNVPGVLAHISGMFASRGYNIDSLAVGETEDPHLSRMTFVVVGDDRVLEQVRRQLEKSSPS